MKTQTIGDLFELKGFNQNIPELMEWVSKVTVEGATKIAQTNRDLYPDKEGTYLQAYKLVPKTAEEINNPTTRTVELVYSQSIQ